MITKMTHTTILVLNQERAFDFYTNKLGFKVVKNIPMNSEERWITVCPPEQPDLEIALSPITRGVSSKEKVEVLKELVKEGSFGVAVFTCNDIYITYEELKGKGVEFTKAPTKEF